MKVFTLPGHAVLSIPSTSEQSFPVTNCYSTHIDHKIQDLPWRLIKQDSSTAFHFFLHFAEQNERRGNLLLHLVPDSLVVSGKNLLG